MRTLLIALVVASLAGCGDSTSELESPTAASKVPAGAPCTGSVAEYCRLGGDGCPTFREAVARRSGACGRPGTALVETRQCAGVYRTVSWRDHLLGGGDEYFDPSADRLTAAYRFSDSLGAFCFRSGSQTFGTVPACPGEVVVTSLCAS